MPVVIFAKSTILQQDFSHLAKFLQIMFLGMFWACTPDFEDFRGVFGGLRGRLVPPKPTENFDGHGRRRCISQPKVPDGQPKVLTEVVQGGL